MLAQLPSIGTQVDSLALRADSEPLPLADVFSSVDVSRGSLVSTDGVAANELLVDSADGPLGFASNLIESNAIDESACDGCASGSCSAHQQSIAVANRWTPMGALSKRMQALDADRFRFFRRKRRPRRHDRGIGYERVMFAPHVLDPAIMTPNVGLRYQIDSGLRTPDRAEYYWGAPPLGPAAETSVNAQDLSLQLYAGNEKAMALTQFTLRSLDPDRADNTTGMGDMVVGAQALMLDGKRLKLSTIFRTYLNTGPEDRGLGRGNISLEHGLLSRYCYSPKTYLFGEFKYWTALSGTPDISGDVISSGAGISTIAMESDVFALIPTFEVRALTFLFGGQTENDGSTSRVDGLTAVELYPGARFVLGPQSDLGLCELGCAAGVTVADDDWFDTRWVISLRWSR